MPDPGLLDDTAVQSEMPVVTSDAVVNLNQVPYADYMVVIDEAGTIREYVPLAAHSQEAAPSGFKGLPETWTLYRAELVEALPHLDSDAWALLVTLSGKELARGTNHPHGNCYGLTSGTFDPYGPSEPRMEMAPEFVASLGLEGGYEQLLSAGKFGENDLLVYYMKKAFDAVPVTKDEDATYAVYGGHIALRLGPPLSQWMSRQSTETPIFLHSTARQIAGGKLGVLIGLFGPYRQVKHVSVKPL